MAEKISIGVQDFENIRKENCFYVDKTDFIKEWWENKDSVTLITRPRRFGKTLNMSMLECFFSNQYTDRGELFEGLSIWEEEKYRTLQGTYPVISLSFANVKETTYENTVMKVSDVIAKQYDKYDFLLEEDFLKLRERRFFEQVDQNMSEIAAKEALHNLSGYLSRYYQKKVIILLDEYDTPMQEAYVNGYWNEMVSFTRGLFNSTFKTNPHLYRALMTGITRVSKESIFSDFNNVEVVTTTSEKYMTAFGFTEQEVFMALEQYNLGEKKEEVKSWYDGFVFGITKDVYNPWSILKFLSERKFGTYWANTSSNSLVGTLIRQGNANTKEIMEDLLQGIPLCTEMDEQIVFNQLDENQNAIWSLLLASGYLKVYELKQNFEGEWEYTLSLTNHEVYLMFRKMIKGWFAGSNMHYNDFIKALLKDRLEEMNYYMNRVALNSFSFYDSGEQPSDYTEPERFYHGFVLGLLVELREAYRLKSNRESGLGRYDVALIPRKKGMDAILIEFKVRNPKKEKDLSETVRNALEQIENRKYTCELLDEDIPENRIRRYGFAFEGKTVLIGNHYAEGRWS